MCKEGNHKMYCLPFLIHSLCSRHPNGPYRTLTGTRRARPRSVFNVRLFNGNLESFIKVLIASLPLDCSPSPIRFLFPSGFLVILVGSPVSVLALIIIYQQQNMNICAKMDSGSLPHESASSGGLFLRCVGWWH